MRKLKDLLKNGVSNNTILLITKWGGKFRRFLSILAIVCVLWSCVSTNMILIFAEDNFIVGVNDKIDTKKNYHTTKDSDFDPSQVKIDGEVIEERTLNSKTFRKVDGTYEVALYDDVIHYETDGKLEDIDNSLNYDQHNQSFENNKNDFRVKFPNKISSNKIIKLSKDKYEVDWKVIDSSKSDIVCEDKKLKTNNIRELTDIRTKVSYQNVQDNLDLEYILTGTKIKENIILRNYVPNFSMSFEYKLKNLVLSVNEYGEKVFINNEGDIIFKFTDLFMNDNNGVESNNIVLDINLISKDTYIIDVTPNDEWLKSASYPVIIDPTIDTTSNNIRIFDTYVNESSPNSNYSSERSIQIKELPPYRCQGILSFEFPMSLIDKVINYSHLTLTNNGAINSQPLYLYMNTEYKDLNYVTWNTKPTYDANLIDYSTLHSGNYVFDVTKAVKQFQLEQTSRINGFTIISKDDSVTTSIFSAECDNLIQRPKIEIGYIDPNGIRDYWTYNSQSAGAAGSGYVSDFTGSLNFVRNEYSFSTSKQTLGLSFNYNINSYSANIGYGPGWKTNYHIKCIYDSHLEKYYTIDGSGMKVYYYPLSDTNGDYVEYLAEDGSGNKLISEYIGNGEVAFYLLTKDKVEYHFDLETNYLDFIWDSKTGQSITIWYTSDISWDISRIKDSSGNYIDFIYDANGNLSLSTLNIKQSNGSFKVLEKVNYNYLVLGLNNYRLDKVIYNKNYKQGSEFQVDEIVNYTYDAIGRLQTANSSVGEKIKYTYNSINKVTKIESFNNTFKFGELNYAYEFKKTRITDQYGNYIVYSFDDYGHTVNMLDKQGTAQFYRYLNIFKSVSETGGIYTFINGSPNYYNNNKLIEQSSPQKTTLNPINNHGFESGLLPKAFDWNIVIESGLEKDTYFGFSNEESLVGNKSLVLSVDGGTKAYVKQDVILDYGEYTLSGYVKNDTNTSNVYIDVSGESSLLTPISNIENDGKWHYVEVIFRVDQNNKNISICLVNHSEGNVFFDSIQIVDGFRDTRVNIVDNPSFENPVSNWYFNNHNVTLYKNDNQEPLYDSILGDYSLKIKGTYNNSSYARTSIKEFLEKEKVKGSLTIGGWVNSEGTPTTKISSESEDRFLRIRVNIKFIDETTKDNYIDFDPTIEGWQYVLQKVKLDYDNVQSIDLYLEYQGEGDVYFDGLQVYYENINSTYEYDNLGRNTKNVDISGDVSTIEYDNNDNHPSRITNGEGETNISYNSNKLVSSVDFNNVKCTPTYNSYGQETTMTIGDFYNNIKTSTTYLSTGFSQYISSTTDEFGGKTNYYYDTLTGLLKAIEDAKLQDTHYIYDNEGKIETIVKAESYVDYQYN